ncbi:Electron transport complex subunit RsxG [termite gut metagenome]|uniref:Electron transport complex subunit RsxG n=1 Tax=termite gut metagenome TaxID=433724 RepID=A0A5J4SF39_9ZZZZ
MIAILCRINNEVTLSFSILGEKNGKKTIAFIVYPAKNGDQLVGIAVASVALGFGGELKVLVGFDVEGNIHNYSLLSHSETPGLGSKASDWFKEGNKGSIKGLNPGIKPLTVSKDGGDIDAITASTITSRAFLSAINKAYAAYKDNADGITSATPKAEPDISDGTTSASPKEN